MPFIAEYDDLQDIWNPDVAPDHPSAFGKWREMTKPLPFRHFRLRIATLWPKQRHAAYGSHSKQRRFAIALAGKAHAVINHEAFALRSGDCVWMPPGVPSVIVNTSELPFSVLLLESTEENDEVSPAEFPENPKVATTSSPRITAIGAIEPIEHAGLFVRPIGRALGVSGFDVEILDLGEDGAPLPYYTRTGSDQVFCVISGSVTAFIEGSTLPLKRYSVYYAPPGEKRELEATPKGQTRVAVFTVRTNDPDETIRYAKDGSPLVEGS